jgi:hypothetical protein
MNIQRFQEFQSSHRFSTVASAFIHVLMMGCLAIAYVQAALRFFPTWQATYVIWMAVIVAAEAMLANFTQREKTIRERAAFLLSEWLVIMLVIQVAILASHGFRQLGSFFASLQENPLNFFHPEFLLNIFPLFLVWLLSMIMAEDLIRLEVDVSELQLENPEVLERDRRQIRKGMSERVFAVGLLLVVLAFIARLEITQIFGEIPTTRAPVYNVVAYYALALVLVSQVQLSALRGHWLWTKAPMRANLAGTWLKYSLIFFAVVAILTVFLPTQYSMGFLATLESLLNLLWQAFMFLAFLVLMPIIGLINFLMSLFKSEGSESEPFNMEPPSGFTADPASPAAWWELVKAILFWTLVIGITGYFVVYYIRQNKTLWTWLRSISLLNWLGLRLRAFWHWMRRVNHRISMAVAAGRQRLFPPVSAPSRGRTGRPFNNQRASARQKIIFFYLRMLERGKEEGLERKPSITPSQYRALLGKALPEVEDEVDGMTASFIEARYTSHEINEEWAGQVQRLWKRFLQALRGKKKK